MTARLEIISTVKYLTMVISLGPWEWQVTAGHKSWTRHKSLSYSFIKPDWSPGLTLNQTIVTLLRRNCHEHAAQQPNYDHIVSFGFAFHNASGKVTACLLSFFNYFKLMKCHTLVFFTFILQKVYYCYIWLTLTLVRLSFLIISHIL